MGHGSYTASDWEKLKESKGISSSSSANNIFKSRSMDDKYNPRLFQFRESCDSNDSPLATPIIIGFDVTGSMGYLAEEIAKNALNKTILNIYDKNPVTNPHVLCAAIGDVKDNAPLQVTQFEADVRVVEQLMDLWLEGAGGDSPEDYNLLWYFADRHTKTDAYEKRNKKGFLFTIGDATVHSFISSEGLKKVFGDNESLKSNKELLQNVQKKYEVFHIVTKNIAVVQDWEQYLPGHVAYISVTNIRYISEVIISLMQLANGMTKDEVFSQWDDENTAKALMEALKTVNIEISGNMQNSKTDKQSCQNAGHEKKDPFWKKLF